RQAEFLGVGLTFPRENNARPQQFFRLRQHLQRFVDAPVRCQTPLQVCPKDRQVQEVGLDLLLNNRFQANAAAFRDQQAHFPNLLTLLFQLPKFTDVSGSVGVKYTDVIDDNVEAVGGFASSGDVQLAAEILDQLRISGNAFCQSQAT